MVREREISHDPHPGPVERAALRELGGAILEGVHELRQPRDRAVILAAAALDYDRTGAGKVRRFRARARLTSTLTRQNGNHLPPWLS